MDAIANRSQGPHGIGIDAGVAPRRSRMRGVDAARALALVGMLAVHVGPEDAEGLGGRLYALAFGRASILFILLAGVGMALLSSGRLSMGEARLRLATYALLLLPIGLILQEQGRPIAVIVHHYAAFFLLGLLVLQLGERKLLLAAAALTLLGPIAYQTGQMLAPRLFTREPVSMLDDPLTVVTGLLLTGPYPLVTWGAPMLWGIWLGRWGIKEPRRHLRICLGGAAVAIGAGLLSLLLVQVFGTPAGDTDWRLLLVDTPHSQMPLWIISGIGAALFVLGGLMLLDSRWPGVLRPLALLGQLSLTMYVLHVLVLHRYRDFLVHDQLGPAIMTTLLLSAAGLVLAIAWRSVFPRGPLEMLLHLPSQLMDRTLSAPAPEPRPVARHKSVAATAPTAPRAARL